MKKWPYRIVMAGGILFVLVVGALLLTGRLSESTTTEIVVEIRASIVKHVMLRTASEPNNYETVKRMAEEAGYKLKEGASGWIAEGDTVTRVVHLDGQRIPLSQTVTNPQVGRLHVVVVETLDGQWLFAPVFYEKKVEGDKVFIVAVDFDPATLIPLDRPPEDVP